MTGRVLVAGGGTAGHVFPAVAVARELTRQAPDVEPVFIGTRDRLEGRLVPAAGFRLHHIAAVPLPRRPSLRLVSFPKSLRTAVRACVAVARQEGAVGAVTFGGYVSFPVAWACARLDLPLVIHEQNAVPGLANRLAARWADRIAVTFPGSADRFRDPDRVAVTGNPVREEVLRLDLSAQRDEARRHFGLAPTVPTLLVFGGSLGARSINAAIIDSLAAWGEGNAPQILHATGESQYDDVARAWQRATAAGAGPVVRCLPFIDDMGLAYAAADAVVCRAGATTIAELTALGLPAVLVPYPHATGNHQLHNARALAQAGAAALIEDHHVSASTLVAALRPWVAGRRERGRVAANARAFGRRDAAANVARLLRDLVDQRRRHGSAAAAPAPGEAAP